MGRFLRERPKALICWFFHQHSQVNGDVLDAQGNMPTIPLTVYQQLKVRYFLTNMSMHHCVTNRGPQFICFNFVMLHPC